MDELIIQNLRDTGASATSDLAALETQGLTQSDSKKSIDSTGISPDTVAELRLKNTESFQCLTQLILSRSSVLGHCLYEFPPLADPGVVNSFDFKPDVKYDNTQTQKIYSAKCKELRIPIIQRVLMSLNTPKLNLRYFGLKRKQIEAITAALTLNEYVRELILEENYLTSETVFHISEMLRDNNHIQYLNLSRCDMGYKCCKELVEGISTTQSVLELDLSWNNMGNEAFRLLLNSLGDNTSIEKLNLSHNSLNDDVAVKFGIALSENENLQELDLSWNCFSTRKAMYCICKGLIAADRVRVLNLSWNGIKDDDTFYFLQRYIFKTSTLQHLDISNNRMQGPVLKMVKQSILGNSSLISVNMSSNLITPNEAYDLAQVFVTKTRKPLKLQYLDMENIVVNKDFVPYWEKVTAAGKYIRVEHVLGNYKIVGPNVVKVLFDRMRYVTNKSQSLRSRREFGHFLHKLRVDSISKSRFLKAIESSQLPKIKKQQNLLKEILKKYTSNYDNINIKTMIQDYYELYPNTTVPLPKKAKANKAKAKKAKRKHRKKSKVKVRAQKITISKQNLQRKAKAEGRNKPVITEQASKSTSVKDLRIVTSTIDKDIDYFGITENLDKKLGELNKQPSQIGDRNTSTILKQSYHRIQDPMIRKSVAIMDTVDINSDNISAGIQTGSILEQATELEENEIL